MAWLNDKREAWRVVLALLLLLALAGPWAFDQINVPAQYPCSPPNIRLYGDFCGAPLSGIRIMLWTVITLLGMGWGVISGGIVLVERMNEVASGIGFTFLLLILAAPFVSTLRLRSEETRRRRIIHIVVWALAGGGGLVFAAVTSPDRFYWALWGIWLYAITAVAALFLEVLLAAWSTTGGAL